MFPNSFLIIMHATLQPDDIK